MEHTPFSTLYVTSSTSPGHRRPGPSERALVLGGGGSLGNAWVIGVVTGLLQSGLDVTDADLVIGTSAGSTAAAQVTSAAPTQLLADILAVSPQRPPRPVTSPVTPAGAPRPMTDHVRRTGEIIAAATDPADMRRRLGAAALELDRASDDEGQSRWRATVAARLPSGEWPHRPVLVTAVDAHTGQPVVFDRHSGIRLADAVAASTASGPPYRIGDRRYIDGGYRRSSDNADLALGYRRVLVLSPFGGRSRAPLEWGMHLTAQVDELRAGGSSVETILPDRDSLDAFGENMMDATRRPAAARAGYGQGRRDADRITGLWR